MNSFRSLSLFCPIVLSMLVLSACGGGGGGSGSNSSSNNNGNNNTNNVATETGVFLDSAVEGLHYETDTQSGTTNSDGEFQYVAGESIIFSIGDVKFQTLRAKAEISPFDLAGTADTSDTELINITRLLQTLDTDADPSNGITISNDAHLSATGMTLNFSSLTFDADVTNLINNSGTTNTALVDGTDAIAHLTSNVSLGGCAATHPSVGYTAQLSTLGHNVHGTATIVDDCTIAVSGFTYDGGGLSNVRFYAGTGGDYANGFSISDNIHGKSYSNNLIVIHLANVSLDSFDGIAVWCVEAGADFGDGTFSAPNP